MSSRKDPETTILLDKVDDGTKQIIGVAKQLLENKMKYETNFDDNLKTKLTEIMKDVREAKHKIELNQLAIFEANEKYESALEQISNLDGNDNENIPDVDEILAKFNMDEDFEKSYEEIKQQKPFQIEQDDYYNKLVQLIRDPDEEDDANNTNEDDLEMLQADFTIPIDPISKQEIQIPFRNKNCNHLYDKLNFLNMLKNKRIIKCPVTGCSNLTVREEDMEEDLRLKILIENKRNEMNNSQ